VIAQRPEVTGERPRRDLLRRSWAPWGESVSRSATMFVRSAASPRTPPFRTPPFDRNYAASIATSAESNNFANSAVHRSCGLTQDVTRRSLIARREPVSGPPGGEGEFAGSRSARRPWSRYALLTLSPSGRFGHRL